MCYSGNCKYEDWQGDCKFYYSEGEIPKDGACQKQDEESNREDKK